MNEELAHQINDVLEENGWDQPHLLYFIAGNEFIKVAEFLEHPLKELQYLTNLHKNGFSMKKQVDAIFLSTEGWSYPKDVFGDGGPALTEKEAIAMWQILPPRAHPNRAELRQVVIVTKDFEIFGYSKTRDGDVIMSGKVNENSHAGTSPQLSGAVYDAVMEYAKEVMK